MLQTQKIALRISKNKTQTIFQLSVYIRNMQAHTVQHQPCYRRPVWSSQRWPSVTRRSVSGSLPSTGAPVLCSSSRWPLGISLIFFDFLKLYRYMQLLEPGRVNTLKLIRLPKFKFIRQVHLTDIIFKYYLTVH